MEQTNIKNDNSPEMENGEITDRQKFRELNYLIRYLLNGYGVSLQCQNFTLAIYTLVKAGQPYQLTDKKIATLLGLSSANYVCNVRKQLKIYFNSEYDSGRKRYQFLSIQEYQFQKGEKPQPTTYVFEKEFDDLIQKLLLQVRENPFYFRDWFLAVKEVCGANKTDLLEFGFWETRKQRRARSWEQIQETMLFHFAQHTRKIFDHAELKGIEPEKIHSDLIDLINLVYEQKYLLKTPRERATEMLKADVKERLSKTKLSTVFANAKETAKAKANFSSLEENKKYVRSSIQPTAINSEKWSESGNKINNADLVKILESTNDLRSNDRTQNKSDIHLQRKRFLEKH